MVLLHWNVRQRHKCKLCFVLRYCLHSLPQVSTSSFNSYLQIICVFNVLLAGSGTVINGHLKRCNVTSSSPDMRSNDQYFPRSLMLPPPPTPLHPPFMCIHPHSTATHRHTFFSDKVLLVLLDSSGKPEQTKGFLGEI